MHKGERVSAPLERLLSQSPYEGEREDFRTGHAMIASLDQRQDIVGDLYEEIHDLDLTTTVAEAHQRASSASRKLKLLYRLVRVQQPQHIVELGTGFGVATAHMALAARRNLRTASVTTVEGSAARQSVAASELEQVGIHHITFVNGLFDDRLDVLTDCDFVFIDGNHYLAPTLQYVEAALARGAHPMTLVLDDLRGYSQEMEQVWPHVLRDARFRTRTLFGSVGVATTGRTPLDRHLPRRTASEVVNRLRSYGRTRAGGAFDRR